MQIKAILITLQQLQLLMNKCHRQSDKKFREVVGASLSLVDRRLPSQQEFDDAILKIKAAKKSITNVDFHAIFKELKVQIALQCEYCQKYRDEEQYERSFSRYEKDQKSSRKTVLASSQDQELKLEELSVINADQSKGSGRNFNHSQTPRLIAEQVPQSKKQQASITQRHKSKQVDEVLQKPVLIKNYSAQNMKRGNTEDFEKLQLQQEVVAAHLMFQDEAKKVATIITKKEAEYIDLQNELQDLQQKYTLEKQQQEKKLKKEQLERQKVSNQLIAVRQGSILVPSSAQNLLINTDRSQIVMNSEQQKSQESSEDFDINSPTEFGQMRKMQQQASVKPPQLELLDLDKYEPDRMMNKQNTAIKLVHFNNSKDSSKNSSQQLDSVKDQQQAQFKQQVTLEVLNEAEENTLHSTQKIVNRNDQNLDSQEAAIVQLDQKVGNENDTKVRKLNSQHFININAQSPLKIDFPNDEIDYQIKSGCQSAENIYLPSNQQIKPSYSVDMPPSISTNFYSASQNQTVQQQQIQQMADIMRQQQEVINQLQQQAAVNEKQKRQNNESDSTTQEDSLANGRNHRQKSDQVQFPQSTELHNHEIELQNKQHSSSKPDVYLPLTQPDKVYFQQDQNFKKINDVQTQQHRQNSQNPYQYIMNNQQSPISTVFHLNRGQQLNGKQQNSELLNSFTQQSQNQQNQLNPFGVIDINNLPKFDSIEAENCFLKLNLEKQQRKTLKLAAAYDQLRFNNNVLKIKFKNGQFGKYHQLAEDYKHLADKYKAQKLDLHDAQTNLRNCYSQQQIQEQIHQNLKQQVIELKTQLNHQNIENTELMRKQEYVKSELQVQQNLNQEHYDTEHKLQSRVLRSQRVSREIMHKSQQQAAQSFPVQLVKQSDGSVVQLNSTNGGIVSYQNFGQNQLTALNPNSQIVNNMELQQNMAEMKSYYDNIVNQLKYKINGLETKNSSLLDEYRTLKLRSDSIQQEYYSKLASLEPHQNQVGASQYYH